MGRLIGPLLLLLLPCPHLGGSLANELSPQHLQADLIVVLDGARVAEVGSHEELMAAAGHYAELYEIQAAAYR